MTNIPLKALSLAVATLVAHLNAVAAPTSEQLNSVKLYSNVTIAQDSVTGWGPWTEFEPPAAGNPPLNVAPASSELYRTLAQPTTAALPQPQPEPEPPIDDTKLLGFGTFFTVVNNVSDGNADALSLTATQDGPTSAGKLLPDTLLLEMTAITGVYPQPTTLQLGMQPNGMYLLETDTQQAKLFLIASPDAPTDLTPAPVTFYQMVSYISDEAIEGDPAVKGVGQTGVIGRTTSTSDLAALRLGNVTATYNGNSLINQGADLAPVAMTVNFGQSSWTGTWNNGVDTNNAVGFSAAGSIAGANFSSTPGSIKALDSNNISGSVTGAFFGSQAAAVGGIADITKNAVHTVNPFIAFKQSPVATIPSAPPAGTP